VIDQNAIENFNGNNNKIGGENIIKKSLFLNSLELIIMRCKATINKKKGIDDGSMGQA
jgi:hypothetical protein